MKNKFKKSKIIVPALALITATTVASVTGTVAWFTANRAITVNAGDFVATKLESNLSVTTAGGLGTAPTTGNTGITTTTGTNVSNKLTHGSYDAKADATGSLYVANVTDDGKEFESFSNLGTLVSATQTNPTTSNCKWLARTGTNENIWYGVSWTMTFKLAGATSTNTTDYLLLDVKNSKFTNSETGTTTAEGFRIAFMNASEFVVLGGDNTVTYVGTSTNANYTYKKATTYDANATYYTNGTDETYTKTTVTSDDFNKEGAEYYTHEWNNSYENYTLNTNYFTVGSEVAKASDESASAETKTLANNALNLGAVDATNGLTVTCVAWYEGSDTHVANKLNNDEINMSDISAELNFYTRGIIA